MPTDKALELNVTVDTPAIKDLLKRCVEAEREACCADVCITCEDGEMPVRREPDGRWLHELVNDGPYCSMFCDASLIRERAYQQAAGEDQRIKSD